MTDVVNKIEVVERIECSWNNTPQPLFVTIVATDPNQPEVQRLTKQSTE